MYAWAQGCKTEGGADRALNNAFSLLTFCWRGTAAVVRTFNCADGGSMPVGSYMSKLVAVLFNADASASGYPIAGVLIAGCRRPLSGKRTVAR